MRGDGRVFQRNGVYWVSYYRGGEEIRESSKSRVEKDARKLLRRRMAEIATKTFVGPKEERLRFEELAEGLLRSYDLRKLRSRDTVAYRVKNPREFFALDRVVDITSERLRQYQEARLREGASGATINREMAALHRAFVLAVKAQLLSRVAVFPDRIDENEPRQGFLEHAEYLAIRAHLPADYADALDFGYHSGWRKHEILRLEWARVDLDGGVIHLDPAHSKNKHGRVLPIIEPLREVLERRWACRRLETARVFHVSGRPIKDWRGSWQSACAAAGLPGKLFHDLRRTAVRNLDRAGVPRAVAMKITGHLTETIYRRYNIVSDEDIRLAGARLASYVSTLSTRTNVTPLRPARVAVN